MQHPSNPTLYRKTATQPMYPWEPGVNLLDVSIDPNATDSPKPGDMIAFDPENPGDAWLVTAEYFAANYEPAPLPYPPGPGKTLHNSDVSGARNNVSDLVTFGDSDAFKLLCKASSKAEDWMKSTKAMEIPGVGCVVQVTTQQGANVAEALVFVPGVRIEGGEGGRRLVVDGPREPADAAMDDPSNWRKITTHKVNGLNDATHITVLDAPGAGGACHEYHVSVDGGRMRALRISFQNGPVKEAGFNGIGHEALLAILRDRLEGFQAGPYACEENLSALASVCSAMDVLHSRTKQRMDRGVEGTNEK